MADTDDAHFLQFIMFQRNQRLAHDFILCQTNAMCERPSTVEVVFRTPITHLETPGSIDAGRGRRGSWRTLPPSTP